MASVSVREVHKSFDDTAVIHGVSIDIYDGEFLVLVGPSGCGKSTLLRMIAGLEDVNDGEIAIGDTVVNDMAPKARDVAMVFQNYALYPHMTVRQNMGFSLRLRKEDKNLIRERVDSAAQILGLTQLLNRLPRQLSGGERQRVAMGRAIVRDPQVFLFDEPLSNLDAKLRVQMRTEIKALHQRLRTTSIYVTHDQVEAMTMAERIVVMNLGRVEQVGRPLDLYDRPANLFVAGFIGSPAMNFIEASVAAGSDAPSAAANDGTALPLPPGAPMGGGTAARLRRAPRRPGARHQRRRRRGHGRGRRADRLNHPRVLPDGRPRGLRRVHGAARLRPRRDDPLDAAPRNRPPLRPRVRPPPQRLTAGRGGLNGLGRCLGPRPRPLS